MRSKTSKTDKALAKTGNSGKGKDAQAGREVSSADGGPAEQDISPSEQWQKFLAEERRLCEDARRSLIEKVMADRAYRYKDRNLLDDMKGHTEVFENAAQGYIDGRFFLVEMSLFLEVSRPLAFVVYSLRQEMIRQYDLRTVPELMLLDQLMIAYFQVVRLNKEVANLMSLAQTELYGDEPWIKVARHRDLRQFDGLQAEEAVKRLQDALLPQVDRFNQMFLRNLKALRELKTMPININIGQAGQVNVAQQQVNVSDKGGR